MSCISELSEPLKYGYLTRRSNLVHSVALSEQLCPGLISPVWTATISFVQTRTFFICRAQEVFVGIGVQVETETSTTHLEVLDG